MKKILLDVGGTFIKCSDGRSVPVDSNASREEIIASFREAVLECDSADVQLRAALPGPTDYASGQLLMTHKYAAVYREFFADLVGLPRENCRFIHDVNCMLLGEIGPDCKKNTAIVALGTGLGFAMSIGGTILKNDIGSPLVSIFDRPFREGVLEDYASKRGVMRLYAATSGQDGAALAASGLTVKDIAVRAYSGETAARQAFEMMGAIIGDAIAPILKEYNVETLLLGGQIARSADLFVPSLKEALKGCRVEEVRTISDIDNATFRGLERL